MTDKIIIKVISKTYLAIVSFFSFIILFLIFLFLLLSNGLYLDNLHISNLHLKNAFVKFDKKLYFVVDEVKIEQQTKSKQNLTLQQLNNYLKIVPKVTPFIDTIAISHISAGDFVGRFNYSSNKKGSFSFSFKDDIHAKATLSIKNKDLCIKIEELNTTQYKTTINGIVIIDFENASQYAKLNILTNNDANLTLYTSSNAENLYYKVISHNKINHIKNILDLVPFNRDVKYWANDAIKAKNVKINTFNGKIDFNDIKSAYKNIHLNAVVYSLKYKYNPKLATIDSRKTELEFKNGILYIKPMQAYTYNTYLKKSWLKIDFTKEHERLDLYLMLDGIVNDDILYLLSVYKIKLPFKQNSGLIDTQLHLSVDLRTIDVNVNGDFSLKQANIDYIGLNLDLFNAHIHLDNSDIIIDKMQAKYQNILDTNISATYNAKKELGKINFQVNSIKYKNLVLDRTAQPLEAHYSLSTDKKLLQISKSKWKYNKQSIILNTFTMPYDIRDSVIKLPPVMISMESIAQAYVNGKINIKEHLLNLDLDLYKLQYGGLGLNQTDAHFKIKYDKTLFINAASNIYITMNGSKYKIKNLKLSVDEKSIKSKRISVDIGQYINTKVYVKHMFGSNKVSIGLNDFVLKNPKTKKVLYDNKKIRLQAFFSENNITIKSPELNAVFYSDANIWKLNLFSLDRISKNSDILKQLNFSNGEVSFYKNSKQSYTQFQASIIYPYALLMNKNTYIHNYNIKGKINKNRKIYLNINKKVKVKITDKVTIKPKNCGINIHEVLQLVKNIQKVNRLNTSSSTTSPKIYLNATNSYIYLSKNRYIISDKIYMQYINNIVTAQLNYKKGQAGFKLENSRFYLYGKDFNDKFMEQFFAFSKFKGGTLDFSLQGTFENYRGLFFMRNTTIVDYKLLNNVLAFVNTVPSLVTFSLPDYNRDGLYVQNGYLQFSSTNGLFNISDFYIQSKELKIIGKGIADITNDKINLTLNLKTDLASDVSKIPLVGYIIFDGKSLSTTLKVTGKLSNPDVQTQLAKDIVVAPLNIIKRTLTLPYKLIKKAVDDVNKTVY